MLENASLHPPFVPETITRLSTIQQQFVADNWPGMGAENFVQFEEIISGFSVNFDRIIIDVKNCNNAKIIQI